MAEVLAKNLNDRIVTGMDGRSNKWLKEKLLEKGISLNDVQVSQRLSGITQWTGVEAIACFEILKIPIIENSEAV